MASKKNHWLKSEENWVKFVKLIELLVDPLNLALAVEEPNNLHHQGDRTSTCKKK
jgi:hypothetical protein